MVHGTGQAAVGKMAHRRLVPLSSRRTAKHRRRGEAAAAKWSVCVSRIEGRTGAPARGATDVATAHKVCACESQPLTLQRCLTSHLRAAAVDGGVWSRRCHWAASVDRMSTRRRRQRGPRAPRGTTGLQAAAGAEGWAVRRRRAHQHDGARQGCARGPGSHTVCTLCAGEACTARDARSCACSESGSGTHAADDFKIVGRRCGGPLVVEPTGTAEPDPERGKGVNSGSPCMFELSSITVPGQP